MRRASGNPIQDIPLILGCYLYIILTILLSGNLPLERKTSRKFLHAMIGNLPFIIPFFSSEVSPVLVALPFIPLTFFASPYSPMKGFSRKMEGLSGISEQGDPLGLVYYAISYTALAIFFASQPYVIAAGILPLAYGDSVAALIGERFGRRRYKLAAPKSLEGSGAMLLVCLLTLYLSFLYFSMLYPLNLLRQVLPIIAVALGGTLIEGITPLGYDNLTIPAACTIVFLLIAGGG